jgi:hypothetical protein
MADHEHDFGGYQGPRKLAWCRHPDCMEVRVGDRRGVWRKLNADETISLTAHMIEAIAIADAMVIVHGQDHGMRRAREVLGYG